MSAYKNIKEDFYKGEEYLFYLKRNIKARYMYHVTLKKEQVINFFYIFCPKFRKCTPKYKFHHP